MSENRDTSSNIEKSVNNSVSSLFERASTPSTCVILRGKQGLGFIVIKQSIIRGYLEISWLSWRCRVKRIKRISIFSLCQARGYVANDKFLLRGKQREKNLLKIMKLIFAIYVTLFMRKKDEKEYYIHVSSRLYNSPRNEDSNTLCISLISSHYPHHRDFLFQYIYFWHEIP